ncbi:dTDP-4-dehydrorhamnose 3,5-epimerase [Sphingomonas sp. PB4P5]|uniref:dTDP-4-dehydrorhamnose 3,5-epimerase n=1 Tax=Parasphingomonas puruogangriensis TaxID=3096155 RepID=UPI002FC8324C
MVEVRPLGLEGVAELTARRFGDPRGWFTETWNVAAFAEAGLDHVWIQDNHAYSAQAGVVRGLHFQQHPFAQAKMVRVVRGSVFDVAVDIRAGSPDFGKWVGLTLTAEQGNQILVPRGFAHGYMTLEPDTEVVYKVDGRYSPAHERAIAWNDPAIGIDWPAVGEVMLADKDRAAPLLADADIGETPQ